MYLNTGRWTEEELDRIILEATKLADPGQRITLISERLLDTPYQESTLIGSESAEEELVINLDGLDCFTFIDYVEALRLSRSFSDFQEKLRQVRYRGGLISYRTRNHFFTDWVQYRAGFVRDETRDTGKGRAQKVQKRLNQKDDTTLFLNGIEPIDRTITYIPGDVIDESILKLMKTGDYAGIYSDIQGLDVSHVGIIIRVGASLFLRHAASTKALRKVTDQDFKEYISYKPGLIILRPI